MLKICAIEVENPIILAPMSGVTDLPFRRLARRYGVGLVVSEMIASQAMIHANRRTMRMATLDHGLGPVAVQLAGREPALFAEAARICVDRGASIIDINFGCPAKKVTNGAAGSALMRDERLAGRIMSATVAAVSVPVTMKMRTGWDANSRNAPDLATLAEKCGVQMITVHGRTRSQFFKGKADWAFIGRIKERVAIPVIGNGDVASTDDARRLMAESGVDGVMVGRAARGRPWLPGKIARELRTGTTSAEPTLTEQRATAIEHFEALLTHHGCDRGVRIARKHIGWYIKGLKGAPQARSEIFRMHEPCAIRDAVFDLYERAGA